MTVDDALFRAAVGQLDARWPATAGKVAAALRLDDGSVRTGVALDNVNAGMTLCAETGPICQAHAEGRSVADSICITRSDDGVLLVLAPCGACQERLALWGPDVQVAVANPGGGWTGRRLAELNPHYWTTAFTDGSRWPTAAEHAE